MYKKHMKRTNLVLDEKILNETLLLSQKKTYSDAVKTAMKEYIRIKEFSNVFQFQGSGVWEGDLGEIRKDSTSKKSKKKK